MLALLRSNKTTWMLLLLALCAKQALCADVTEDPLSEYKTRGNRHGLYEIREAARDFVDRERRMRRDEWQVGDPDIRVVVWECAVPLKSAWRVSEEGKRTGVFVTCNKTLVNAPVPKWRVTVPIAPLKK